MPALNNLAARMYDDESTFSDRVHFVHVYVLEPHPMSPDPSPFSGYVSELNYSTVGQARTYAERLSNALQTRSLIDDTHIQLIDDLDTEGAINPVWCTYGPTPNGTYLIGQDGVIEYVAVWTFPEKVEAAIRLELGG